MLDRNISMPHPVLGVKGDFRHGAFNLSFNIKVDRVSRLYTFEQLNVQCTSDFINELYRKKYLSLVIKISCTPTYRTWTWTDLTQISLPESEVDQLLEIDAYLIANQAIDNYSSLEFNDDFEGVSFTLVPGDIVALSGSIKIPIVKENEKVSIGSIFRFAKIPPTADIQELHFDYEDDQIVIYYPGVQIEYDPVALLFDKTQGLPYTALNMYVIPALAGAFDLLINDDGGGHSEKKWALILEALLPRSQWQDNPFIAAQKAIRQDVPTRLAFMEIARAKKIL